MLDRFRIDDGRHLPRLQLVEVASAAAGAARYTAACSCDRMTPTAPGTHEQALNAHVEHARAYLGPARGPSWLPWEVRIIALLVLMLILASGGYLGGLLLVDVHQLTGTAAQGAHVGGVLLGFTAAFALMVAVRRFIAPTRA